MIENWQLEFVSTMLDIDWQWLGPISPDSYQQGRVAGLAKAVEIIKANTDVKKAIEIIRLHSLAQQAQDEKGWGMKWFTSDTHFGHANIQEV